MKHDDRYLSFQMISYISNNVYIYGSWRCFYLYPKIVTSLLLRFHADYYLKYLFKFYATRTNTRYTCLFVIFRVCINILVTGIGVAFFFFVENYFGHS